MAPMVKIGLPLEDAVETRLTLEWEQAGEER